MPALSDEEIPAFLKDDRDVDDLLADIESEDDGSFDFPELDEVEPDDTYTEEDKADDDYQAGKEAEADATDVKGKPASNFGGEQLKAIIERIERLEEEKKTTAEDIREIYAEAKGNGFNPKTIRKVIAARKKDKQVRDEEEQEYDLYMWSIGMGSE